MIRQKKGANFLCVCSVAGFLAVAAFPLLTFASYPATEYAPGETTNPLCSPGMTNCSVQTTEIERGTGVPTSMPTGLEPIIYVDESTGYEYTWDGTVWVRNGLKLYAENPDLLFYSPPDALGVSAVAIGNGSSASGHGAIALGGGIASIPASNASNINAFAAIGGAASGESSIAIGPSASASANFALAFGVLGNATGINSVAFGMGSGTTASGTNAFALGDSTVSSGSSAIAMGEWLESFSRDETTFGSNNTVYTPTDTTSFNAGDRLFTIGNGTDHFSRSDAFTILKDGETGVGIDNFEANTNGNIFQVGDGTTNVIGYVDNLTGNWIAVSDERKKDNIVDLPYGLDTLMQLRPVSFDYKRNGEHTIGFLAQQVQPLVPEAVYGNDADGYGMSYATLVPVVVKSVQELEQKIVALEGATGVDPAAFFASMIDWFGNVANGIGDFFAHTAHVQTLCVGTSGDETCLTKDQIDSLLKMQAQGVSTDAVVSNTDQVTSDTTETADATNSTDATDAGDTQAVSTDDSTTNAADNTSSDNSATDVSDTPDNAQNTDASTAGEADQTTQDTPPNETVTN